MQDAVKVQIFLEDGLRQSAMNGQHNFLSLVADVLSEAGLVPEWCAMRDRDAANGLSLTHMKPPATRRGLVFRRVYHYPFWQIEQTDKRWHWDVASSAFDPLKPPHKEAERFQNFWRKRLFGNAEAKAGDAVYVPLQGLISKHRSFQTCAPLDMVRAVLAATDRPVVVTLHPKETYSERDLSALQDLASKNAHMSLTIGGMEDILPSCHCVVTMNSSAAFNGYFFNKPAILFANIDFHHIAETGRLEALGSAIANPKASVDFASYLWWFWQDQSINAGRPEAKKKIRARLARFGWLDHDGS